MVCLANDTDMNTAGTDRSRMALRSSRSTYGSKILPGVKGAPDEARDRKTLFRAPQKPLTDKQNVTNQCRTIPRIAKTGMKETGRTSKAFTTHKKQNLMSVKFVRPSVDMMAARKRMIERNMRMGELLVEDCPKKNAEYKNKIIMEKLYMGHTPKQSALSKVYQKLGESIKKSAQSAKTVHASPQSPFEELHMQINRTQNTAQTAKNNNNNDNINNNNVVTSLEGGTRPKETGPSECNNAVDKVEGMETDRSQARSVLHGIEDASDFTGVKTNNPSEIKSLENNRECVMNNILKHCRVYSKKISDITDSIICLDESFQRVIIAEIGGQVYSRFCEYRKKKMELEKEMKGIEEELEEAVKKELDLQMKFQEYLSKKYSKWKEESDLLEEFKRTVDNVICEYEKELTRPRENKNLEEIVGMLVSSCQTVNKDVEDAENSGFVLRRSKRLLATPKTPDTGTKCARVLRSSCGKRNREGDDSDVKESSRKRSERRRRRIQRDLYTDLQKRFQLLSPESSF